MSFKMEERLYVKYENQGLVRALFLDPGEGTLYANVEETIYEWNLQIGRASCRERVCYAV